MLKKIKTWFNNKFDFSEENFKRNWKRNNNNHKELIKIWKWIALLAFIAGFTLAAGIYSQKVNNEVQKHIDTVNTYFYGKYGNDYLLYMKDEGVNLTLNLSGGIEYDGIRTD